MNAVATISIGVLILGLIAWMVLRWPVGTGRAQDVAGERLRRARLGQLSYTRAGARAPPRLQAVDLSKPPAARVPGMPWSSTPRTVSQQARASGISPAHNVCGCGGVPGHGAAGAA